MNTVFPDRPNDFEALVIKVNIVDGAGTYDPNANRWIKWKVPTCNPDGEGTSASTCWVVTFAIVHSFHLGQVRCFLNSSDKDDAVEVPVQHQGTSRVPNEGAREDRFIAQLDALMSSHTDDGSIFALTVLLEELAYYHEVCQFEIKDFRVEIKLQDEEYVEGGRVGMIAKKQMATGKSRSRLQRLERKHLNFSMSTNAPLSCESARGFVKRVNGNAMIGKEKAVAGETEVPLQLIEATISQTANDIRAVNYCYCFKTNLDPDQFYDENPGKELYTSDRSSPENNVFVFNVCVSVDGKGIKQEIYRFKTKSKDYSNKQSEDILKVMQLEANRACIKDLSIEKLSTRNGDIAYTWHLMNIDTAGRYEEGDVIGIFPDSNHPDDKTFIDFLTPNNYKDATLAGVITRSYYLTANSREGIEGGGRPSEKICMIGKIKIKVFGSVKHGDFIFASNRLPGVAVTENQLINDKDNWRKKRLLGYSIETNQRSEVKLVTCIVSILLSINNDQVENLLNKLGSSLSEEVEEKLNRFRDDVDIRINGINEIVNTTHIQMTASKHASFRRNCRVCFVLLSFVVVAILTCYMFLSPNSPYIKWKCYRGSLKGTLTFEIDNDQDYVDMKGVLFKWDALKRKLDLGFNQKENFTGSYYINLRRCESENLRKVLSWFSSPPVYYRAPVFAADCDCKTVYHHRKYHSWKEYNPVYGIKCEGQKGPCCNSTESTCGIF